MGKCFSKNNSKHVIKNSTIKRPSQNSVELKNGMLNLKKVNEITVSRFKIKRKLHQRLHKNIWIKVLDFLPYRDLCQAGKTNRFFQKVAKNQDLLAKFYKKKKQSLHTININIINNLINVDSNNLKTSSLQSIPSFKKDLDNEDAESILGMLNQSRFSILAEIQKSPSVLSKYLQDNISDILEKNVSHNEINILKEDITPSFSFYSNMCEDETSFKVYNGKKDSIHNSPYNSSTGISKLNVSRTNDYNKKQPVLVRNSKKFLSVGDRKKLLFNLQ